MEASLFLRFFVYIRGGASSAGCIIYHLLPRASPGSAIFIAHDGLIALNKLGIYLGTVISLKIGTSN